MVEKRCPSCRFHGTLGGEIICDYIQIAGKSRLSQIPREDRDKPCRLFEQGKKVKLMFKPVTFGTAKLPRFRFDQRKMLELYERGLTDREIALAIGCVSDTVGAFRKRNGLPSNYRPVPPGRKTKKEGEAS